MESIMEKFEQLTEQQKRDVLREMERMSQER